MQALKTLSDQRIMANVNKLVSTERTCTAKLIAHLAEIYRRSLHLKLGYKSMFEYCQKELQLEESQIWLRTQVAKKTEMFPQLLDELRHGRMSLTVCGRIAPHLTINNFEKIITNTRGLSRVKVEEYLVKIKPRNLKSTSIRRVPQPNNLRDEFEVHRTMNNANGVEPSGTMNNRYGIGAPGIQADSDIFHSSGRCRQGDLPAIFPATESRYNISLNVSKELKEKLDRLAAVLGQTNTKDNVEDLLNFAIEAALEKKDPMRKAARAEKRIAKKSTEIKPSNNVKSRAETVAKIKTPAQAQAQAHAHAHAHAHAKLKPPQKTRYIPAKIAAQVMQRANFQCQYKANTYRRCSQTSHLQIDHIKPYAKGGTHHSENLQVLCQAHNLQKAKTDYGVMKISSNIEASHTPLPSS